MLERTAIAAALAFVAFTAAADIERVEPPNWWIGFEHRELQLLVHGDGIAGFEPVVDRRGVTVSRSERTGNPNYLFVYLDIAPDAKPGEFDIDFTSDTERLTHRYRLDRRNTEPGHADGFSSRDAIYLVTPDRFANGDPGNDTVDGFGDALDRDDDYGRHGGDLAGLIAHLDYIERMGFTQLWLNPVLENRMPEASYHGYATTDFYAVDPRFGTLDDYVSLSREAKRRGIGLIMDMIANHIGSGHWWMRDLPGDDWLNYQGSPLVLSNHARTVNQDRYASDYDRQRHVDGWFVESMPDLNQRNPLLADYLIQNAIWWIETVSLSGIRMDTWPYPDKHFMSEWARRILVEYPSFNIVGEEWSMNPAIVSYWQRGKANADGYVSHLPALFDFPLQAAVVASLTEDVPWWDSPWKKVYESVANDFLYPDPMNLVIFPDNHDMDRIFTQLGEDVALYEMAMVLFATMRGIPQFFYGDEILMSHPGTSSHGALRMDFPGGWEGDTVDAFSGRGLTDSQANAQALLRRLLNWRKGATVIHDGAYMHFAPDKNVFAFFRYDARHTVMTIFNRGDEAAQVDMARFRERTDGFRFGTDVLTGKRYNIENALTLPPRSVLLLELD